MISSLAQQRRGHWSVGPERLAAAMVVRRATDGDETAILELNRMHNGEEAAVELRSAFGAGHIAPDDFALAVVGIRVVSTVGLLPRELTVGDVVLPTGQPEFIATEPAFRGQGPSGSCWTWSTAGRPLVVTWCRSSPESPSSTEVRLLVRPAPASGVARASRGRDGGRS
jgi:hypothetical protein